jgi:hypothetical protein
MNMPDTMVAEMLRRSSLRVEQQRIHVAELSGQQALLAEGVLTEMLASIDRLTSYRTKLLHGEDAGAAS